MELHEYVGKRIKVIDIDDQTFEGGCIDYAQAADNDPEIPSIAIKVESGLVYELYENEIKSIMVVE